jgi:superfamily II DNA or RNA helicase
MCSLVHKFGGKDGDDSDPDVGGYVQELKKALPPGFKAKGDIYVFVDECHRTQSGELHAAMKTLLPNAMFIGFTGTPLLKTDKQKSIEVFGRYIHTYKFDEAVAAAIAGGFSLVGLFITKEQDTSKFRQAWIDELRRDMALLVAHAHQIQAYILISTEADNGERWKATREDFLELNKASTRIKLRLNPTECDSRLILRSLREMEELFKELKLPANRTDASFDKIFGIVSALERDSAPLLKKEWVRVKEGEPILPLR